MGEVRVKKARGAAQNVQQKMARLDVLAHKALRFWEKTLDDGSDATTGEKIQVSKLVVEYAWGKPKQQVQVDAKVEVNHKAHVEALTLLAMAANGPVIDHNPLNQLANSSDVAIQPLLPHGQTNPIDVVEIGLAAALDDGADHLDPPPGGAGTPGGALAHGQAPPLDTKNDE